MGAEVSKEETYVFDVNEAFGEVIVNALKVEDSDVKALEDGQEATETRKPGSEAFASIFFDGLFALQGLHSRA